MFHECFSLSRKKYIIVNFSKAEVACKKGSVKQFVLQKAMKHKWTLE